MKILLIAYEFPPSPSPQSLRWVYLSRELVRQGHDVHVLAPDLGPEDCASMVADAITVHRTYAGPMRGFIASRRRRRSASRNTAEAAAAGAATVEVRQRTPLKIRLVNLVYRISEHVWFPDIRGEWLYFARRRMRELLPQGFDVVISSHEPATTLQLGLDAKRSAGVAWVADLGDPVLAPYTPRRWRRRAARLERLTCRTADRVTVTADSARRLLIERHQPERSPTVVTQGFAARRPAPMPPRAARLELVYAGSFYSFRRAEALFEAVAAVPDVRLTVATVRLPESLRAIAEAHPGSFRLMGFVSHADALSLQDASHVLVNIANADAAQVPGKLYEYFGAQRPVLHLTHGGADPGADLVRELARGWVVNDDRASIESHLRDLLARGPKWADDVDLSAESVQRYCWSDIGAGLDRLLREIVARP